MSSRVDHHKKESKGRFLSVFNSSKKAGRLMRIQSMTNEVLALIADSNITTSTPGIITIKCMDGWMHGWMDG